jgi:hypothetical protein
MENGKWQIKNGELGLSLCLLIYHLPFTIFHFHPENWEQGTGNCELLTIFICSKKPVRDKIGRFYGTELKLGNRFSPF